MGSDRRQGALEPVEPRSAESVDPARANLGKDQAKAGRLVSTRTLDLPVYEKVYGASEHHTRPIRSSS